MAAIFALTLPSDTVEPDVLELWHASAESLTFGARSTSSEVIAHWQVELPGDLFMSQQALHAQEATLSTSNAALQDARHRLQRFVTGRQAHDTAASFALHTPTLREPEQQLAAWVRQPAGEESFLLGSGLWAEVRQLAEQARRFIAQVRAALAYAARVETTQGGLALARTEISWLGDVTLFCRPGLSEAQRQLHRRSVAAMIATKGAWLRLIAQLTQSALQMAAAFFTGNIVWGLAAAWRFIKAILAEWQRRSAQVPTAS